MLALKATYEDGKLIPEENINLPLGRKHVIVTFLDEEEDELSEEFKQELETRLEDYKSGSHKSVDGPKFLSQLREKYN